MASPKSQVASSKLPISLRRCALVLLALILFVPLARAGEKQTIPVEPEKERSLFEPLWRLPVLYQNADSPFLQKVALIGRYHGTLYHLDSNFGDHRDWENRRVRLGAQIDFLRTFDFNFHLNLNIEDDAPRFFQNIEDTRLRWRPTKTFALQVGRQKMKLTNEWWESSNRLDFVERSQVFNQAIHPKMWGVYAEGTFDKILYHAGLYTPTEDLDWNWPEFQGAAILHGGLGYQLTKTQALRADYAYLTDLEENNTAKPYEHTAVLSYDGTFDRLRWRGDAIYGVGIGTTPDVYGITVYPTYDLIKDKLRAVVRYQYSASPSSNGVTLQRRYEQEAPDLPGTKGDNYHAVYGGLSYHIYGHNLKLQAGVEYATADLPGGDNFEAVTYLAGVRFSF